LDGVRHTSAECFGKGSERETVENHRQGISLGNSFAGKEDGAGFSMTT
jgi:hypothetical protein